MPRFLVVDHDHSTVTGMTQLLILDGHTVAPFTVGAEAVDALSRESFDAIVTDLEMPGTDGCAIARAAREHQPDACVVVVTARAESARKAIAEAGACIIADKPVDYEELTRSVAACRAQSSAPGGHHRCQMRSRSLAPVILPMRRR